jgi:phosphate:Na+ symporter
MASLNLSKNARRAAYAHITFNFIGVLVMLPLFPTSIAVLTWTMGWFGGDPGSPVVRNGVDTFPLVPVAVGLFSIGFNIFNTAILFPFVGVFERVLSRIGHSAADGAEDFSVPRYLDPRHTATASGVPLVRQEMHRYVSAAGLFLSMARASPLAAAARGHHTSLDILGREIGRFTAAILRADTPPGDADLLASLIEEADFTASLAETLYQVVRRVEREPFSAAGRLLVDATLDRIALAMRTIAPDCDAGPAVVPSGEDCQQFLLSTRQRCLGAGPDLPWSERGRILELLGTAERAFFLIDRIEAERNSVPRVVRVESQAVVAGLPGQGLAAAIG